MAKKKSAYSTHKTRFSDSSVYDEVCVKCGATDARGDDRLNSPCPKQKATHSPYDIARIGQKE